MPHSRRSELYSLLGDLPNRNRPISVKSRVQRRADGYLLEELVLDLNGLEDVPAYFVRPV